MSELPVPNSVAECDYHPGRGDSHEHAVGETVDYSKERSTGGGDADDAPPPPPHGVAAGAAVPFSKDANRPSGGRRPPTVSVADDGCGCGDASPPSSPLAPPTVSVADADDGGGDADDASPPPPPPPHGVGAGAAVPFSKDANRPSDGRRPPTASVADALRRCIEKQYEEEFSRAADKQKAAFKALAAECRKAKHAWELDSRHVRVKGRFEEVWSNRPCRETEEHYNRCCSVVRFMRSRGFPRCVGDIEYVSRGGQASVFKGKLRCDVSIRKDGAVVLLPSPATAGGACAVLKAGDEVAIRYAEASATDGGALRGLLCEMAVGKRLSGKDGTVAAYWSTLVEQCSDSDGKKKGASPRIAVITVMKFYAKGNLGDHMDSVLKSLWGSSDGMKTLSPPSLVPDSPKIAMREFREHILPLVQAMLRSILTTGEASIAHRDATPRNFLVDENGRVVIADYGFSTPVVDFTSALQADSVIGGGFATIPHEARRMIGTYWYLGPKSFLFLQRGQFDQRGEDLVAFAISVMGWWAGCRWRGAGLGDLLAHPQITKSDGTLRQIFTYWTIFAKYDDARYGSAVSAFEAHLQHSINAVMARVPPEATWEKRRSIFEKADEFVALRLDSLLIHDTMVPVEGGFRCLPIRELLQRGPSPLAALADYCRERSAGYCRASADCAASAGELETIARRVEEALQTPWIATLHAKMVSYSEARGGGVETRGVDGDGADGGETGVDVDEHRLLSTLFSVLSPNSAHVSARALLTSKSSYFVEEKRDANGNDEVPVVNAAADADVGGADPSATLSDSAPEFVAALRALCHEPSYGSHGGCDNDAVDAANGNSSGSNMLREHDDGNGGNVMRYDGQL